MQLSERSKGPYLLPLTRDETPELESTYQDLIEFLGFVPNTELTMARMPRTTKALIDFVKSIYGDPKVGRELLMLCGLLSSATVGCMYCATHNASAANDLGLASDKIAAVWEFETNPIFDEREKAALSFALKIAQTPSGIETSDFHQMMQFFDEIETAEILMAMSHFGIFNRFNDSIAVEGESTPMAFCKAHLPKEHCIASVHEIES